MTERQLQQQIHNWFTNNFCLKTQNPRSIIFSVANEATRHNSNLLKTGVLSGVSDLIVVHNGKVLFVELKAEKGTQKARQLDFEERVISQGLEYYICRSLEDFKEIIK